MQGTTLGSRKRGRPKTTWMDNIFQWTGYTLDKILAYTEDRVRWRQLVHGVAKPWSEDSWRQGKAIHVIWQTDPQNCQNLQLKLWDLVIILTQRDRMIKLTSYNASSRRWLNFNKPQRSNHSCRHEFTSIVCTCSHDYSKCSTWCYHHRTLADDDISQSQT